VTTTFFVEKKKSKTKQNKTKAKQIKKIATIKKVLIH